MRVNSATNGGPENPARSRQKIDDSRDCLEAGGHIYFYRTPDYELLTHLDFLRVAARHLPVRVTC
jgi:hypothetical protein